MAADTSRHLTRRTAYALVAAAAIVPRLAVLLHERSDILTAFTEKSDRFAQVLVGDGTFGFIAGRPSAFTQPLYSFFLAPIYWIVGRDWWTVGFAQVAIAAATALLIYETGRRFLSPRAGLLAALIATLNPYLVWHDVHVNRESSTSCCWRQSCCSRSPASGATALVRRRCSESSSASRSSATRVSSSCRSSSAAISSGAGRAGRPSA